MSDIGGPAPTSRPANVSGDGPKAAERAARPGAVARQHDHHPHAQQGGRNPSYSSGGDDDASSLGRDPAVAISASAAHVAVGEAIQGQIARIDQGGRPILATHDRDYALRPDAGLKARDAVTLVVTDNKRDIEARIDSINAKPPEHYTKVSLTVIAIHHQTPDPSDATVLDPKALSQSYSAPGSLAAQAHPPAPQGADIAALSNVLARPDISPQAPPQILPPSLQNPTQAAATQASLLALDQPAWRPDGTPVTLNIADGSLAAVLGSAATTVSAVEPLTLEGVRSLALPATLLQDPNARLTALVTPVGRFIVPQIVSQQAVGALLVVSEGGQASPVTSTIAGPIAGQPSPQITAPAATAPPPATPSFEGILTNSDQSKSTVALTFPVIGGSPTSPATSPQTTAQTIGQTATQTNGPAALPLGSLPITSVQITDNRLTADGPRADIRLGTAIGTIETSLPPSARPRVGEPVLISQLALPASAPSSTAGASEPLALAVSSSPQDLLTLPSMSEAFTLMASAGAVTAQSAAPLSPASAAGTGSGAGSGEEPSLSDSVDDAVALVAGQDMAARSAAGGAKLTNSLLFFLAAMGAKKPGALLGEAAEQALKARDPSLFERITRDISSLFTVASERASGDWRAFTLPFDAKDGAAQMFNLFVRDTLDDSPKKDARQDPAQPPSKITDFVLQVDFTILGPVQLLGRIENQQFDLSLANQKGLEAGLQQDLRALFASSLAVNGYHGSLSFVTGTLPEDILLLMQDASANSSP